MDKVSFVGFYAFVLAMFLVAIGLDLHDFSLMQKQGILIASGFLLTYLGIRRMVK